VAAATTNTRQVCVALNSGELVYFELDLNGVLQVCFFLVAIEISAHLVLIGVGIWRDACGWECGGVHERC
jgi:hypothetical protein